MPEIVEVMQWTDLIIFDYITGNYDRIASNQDAAEKEHIPEILADNIHNLRRDKQTNTIWLIDNESGFLDGYELMRNPKKSAEAKRFISFHKQMLNSICIFRKSTIRNLNKLHFHGNPAEMLLSEVHRHEPLSDFLPKIPEKLKFHETMKSRISDVYDRVQLCKRRFRRSE
ncbi:four-jointed box protein 1-like [Ptychodera flava]|uniref:four-jointed box protein 1-like n=1 Tax=Ptychodera flava TaxID=63121 RepID=UPI003969DA17